MKKSQELAFTVMLFAVVASTLTESIFLYRNIFPAITNPVSIAAVAQEEKEPTMGDNCVARNVHELSTALALCKGDDNGSTLHMYAAKRSGVRKVSIDIKMNTVGEVSSFAEFDGTILSEDSKEIRLNFFGGSGWDYLIGRGASNIAHRFFFVRSDAIAYRNGWQYE